MTEDKHAICDALLPALKLTRAGAEIEALRYSKERETVTIAYHDGITPVNVDLDSGAAMILDIVKALL